MSKNNMKQLDYLFNPTSVAVIGASNAVGTWGFGVMARLLNHPERKVYPVNLGSSEVLGVKAYQNIVEIPEDVDFAVLSVPPKKTPDVMKECVAKGVKAALVIAGGLAEANDDGAKIERELVKIARKGDLRFIGPNSMGHASTNSKFSTLAWMEEITPGPVAFLSQSGTYGQRVVRTGMQGGIGFSKFVSNGNEADLHLEDYIEYLAHDKDTKIITAYVEGLREGKRFFKLASEITRSKPIVIMTSGGTDGSAKAAKSHTAALSGSKQINDAMYRQAGVIKVEDEDELFDVVLALLSIPLPHGDRIGILTEGGGIGVVAAEACEKVGLRLPSFSTATTDMLRSTLPARCSCGNPTDMTDVVTAGKAVTFPCLFSIMDDPNVDAAMLLGGVGASAYFSSFMGMSCIEKVPSLEKDGFQQMIDHLNQEELKHLDLAAEKIKECGKPLVFVNLMPRAMNEPQVFSILRDKGIPVYPNPMRAAKVLRHLVKYHNYLEEAR